MRLASFAAAAIAAAFVTAAGTAFAGVIEEQQETVTRGGPQPMVRTRTIMIQANKQKIVGEHDIMITDLDKGVMMLIVPEQKVYSEMPFPPKAMGGQALGAANVKFAKSEGTRTIIGYKCQNYSGVSHMMGTHSDIIECFSTSAPGAADFTAFQKAMAAKLKGTDAAAMVEDVPPGVPLFSQSTTDMKGLRIPGMPPEQAAKLAQMMANRPPTVSKSVATKLTVKSLADSEFGPPAGYTRREMPTPHAPGAGAPPASGGSGAPSAHSLPE